MAENSSFSKLDDDMLDTVSGGKGMDFEMENDPMYQKFAPFWNSNIADGTKGSGMESRAEFMNAFRKWISDGAPDNIAGWYNTYQS